MAAMGNKNKIWQRFNINRLWLDPSELIYNARFRAHFSDSSCAHLHAENVYFRRFDLVVAFYLLGIFTGFPLDLICMRISCCCCFFMFISMIRLFVLFFRFFFSSKKTFVFGLIPPIKYAPWIGRYLELWQIEKIISFYRIGRRKKHEMCTQRSRRVPDDCFLPSSRLFTFFIAPIILRLLISR